MQKVARILANTVGGAILAVALLIGGVTVLTVDLRASVARDEYNWRMFNAGLPVAEAVEVATSGHVLFDGHRLDYLGLDEEAGTPSLIRALVRVSDDAGRVRFLYVPVTEKPGGGYYGKVDLVRHKWPRAYVTHADNETLRVILY